MSVFNQIPDRMIDLAEKLGQTVKQTVNDTVPGRAEKLLQTGVALGAVRGGAKTAMRFARRNPAVTAGVAVGAGLLWLAARHRAKKAREAPLEGKAVRVEARRDSRVPQGGDAGDYFE
ncbi:MAG: hypothetical protein Q4F49_01145 [Pseudoxanthomonas suwonensis]|nr:hypothetical protein [Pseudoxanthomonas suwonensis]